MNLVTLSDTQKQRFFYGTCVALGAIMLLTAKQTDPGVVAAAVLLGLVSIYPLYFWLLGYSCGLPLWPVFVLINGVSAALPMVQAPDTLDAYSAGEIIVGGVTYVGFIVVGTVFWLGLTGRAPRPPKTLLMVSRARSTAILFGFVGAGIFYFVNGVLNLIPLPGNTWQIVRGVCFSLNTMGIFVLAFYLGRGLLTKAQGWLLVILTTLTAALMAQGLILASAVVPVAMIFLGFILGSGKIPWKSLALAFVIVSILHPGKYAMRASYWGGGGIASIATLPAYYWEWFGYGLQELGGASGILTGPRADSEATSVLERAGTIHMLLRVQKMSPAEVPFLNGLTYEQIPALLVPRFIFSEKGLAHQANIMLTVNYGVQNIDQALGGTSIAWGLITEAFANFGYLGVAGLSIFLAGFYAYFSRLSVGVPMTSLRFVVALLVMGAAVKADTMALFITSQFQAIAGVSVAALFLMRRQENPLAEESGDEGMRHDAYGRRHEEEGVRYTANGGGEQVSAGGGVVRTMPVKTPQRIARWMPRRVRAAVVAQQQTAADNGTSGPQDGGADGEKAGELHAAKGRGQTASVRPRQLAVPYQNYRRYRG